MNRLTAGILCALCVATIPAWAAPALQQKQVQFRQGETGVTLKGRIKGDQTIDYTLRANAGQALVVIFKPTNLSAYFNVLPPGSDEAIFIGSSSGNAFSTVLKANGEYTLRVYLMRNAARRNESADFTLQLDLSSKTP